MPHATPRAAPTRIVRQTTWMPWRGHNDRVLAERDRQRHRYFGWSPRDPDLYLPALREAPLFYSAAAAANAAALAGRAHKAGNGQY